MSPPPCIPARQPARQRWPVCTGVSPAGSLGSPNHRPPPPCPAEPPASQRRPERVGVSGRRCTPTQPAASICPPFPSPLLSHTAAGPPECQHRPVRPVACPVAQWQSMVAAMAAGWRRLGSSLGLVCQRPGVALGCWLSLASQGLSHRSSRRTTPPPRRAAQLSPCRRQSARTPALPCDPHHHPRAAPLCRGGCGPCRRRRSRKPS
mmetsp:Transcript_65295/g.191067  ORF Transcript_65295/g.191067 Transcript_65295/m.191067 type:complete len:206 (+) Transcript_65295:243-860(+)